MSLPLLLIQSHFMGFLKRKLGSYLSNHLSHKVDWINDYILDNINVRKSE